MSGRILLGEGDGGIVLRDVQDYLIRYGYAGEEVRVESILAKGGATWTALRRFQEFFGLAVTGIVDKECFNAMKTERCGVADKDIFCRWSKEVKELVCEFGKETLDLKEKGKAFEGVEDAIGFWNAALQDLGIDLRFRKRNVGDTVVHVQFDWRPAAADRILVGPPVAHADFPPDCSVFTTNLPKPVHFDDDVTWSNGKASKKFHIRTIAMHELGHILGLGHASASVPGSIMSPVLPDNFVYLGGLINKDKEALLELYK